MSKITKLEKPVEKEMTHHLMDEHRMEDDLSFRLAQNILDGLLDRRLITDAEYELIRQENIRTFSPFFAELMPK